MTRLAMILSAILLLAPSPMLAADDGPLQGVDKAKVLKIMKHGDESSARESLVKLGPSILPVLLEMAKSPATEDWQRARAFAVVRDMPGIKRDEFVAMAAERLPVSTHFGRQSLSLIEMSKSSKYANAVCDYLIHSAEDDIKEKHHYSRFAEKAILAVGTPKELKRMEKWVADHKPEPGHDEEIWKNIRETTRQLRARLEA